MNKYADFYFSDGELYDAWCSEGNPLLEVGVLYRRNSAESSVLSPREGSYNLNLPVSALASSELCLFYRNSGLIFRKIARVSDAGEVIKQIGYGRNIEDQNNSISEEVASHSSDYSLYGDVYRLLGLTDAVYGNAPMLKHYPSVSVVIPGYKVENTIYDTIEAFSRSFRNCGAESFEIIVVDDANEKPMKISEKNVRVIRSDKKVYCGGARNVGIGNAVGDIIVFCDGDTCVAGNFIQESIFRQMVAPNIITVCMRENISRGEAIPDRLPSVKEDTRYFTVYRPGRIGSTPVNEVTEVRALAETDNFKNFGYGKKLGPADLPFMVKGNNICVDRSMAKVLFPPDFIGYGPEDVTFAAKIIARGCKVIPILSSGVFHREHPVRSDSTGKKDEELRRNIVRQMRCLQEKTWEDWSCE